MYRHPVTLRLVGGTREQFDCFLKDLIELRHGNDSGLFSRPDGSVHSKDVGDDKFEGDVWEISTKYPKLVIGMSSRTGCDPWEDVMLKGGTIVGNSSKKRFNSFSGGRDIKYGSIPIGVKRDTYPGNKQTQTVSGPACRPTPVEVVKQGGHVFTIEKVEF